MPLFLTLKNRIQFAIEGEKINPSDWKGKKWRVAKGMNGHELVVLTSEVCIVEYVPLDEYKTHLEQARQENEKKLADQQGRIARPAMMIPKKVN